MICRKTFHSGALVLLALTVLPVRAEEASPYVLSDSSGKGEIGTYDTLDAARNAYRMNLDEYDNLTLTHEGRVLMCEYGIVVFPQKENCAPTTYINTYERTESTVSGCYAADAALLDSDGEKTEFLISGARGITDTDEIEIIPEEMISSRLSVYTVYQGRLYHEIKNEMDDDNYFSIINTGEAPSYLKEGESYFSYDGHYFYRELRTLLRDSKAGTHEGSVNPEQPRYEYYQFLSHRSLTGVSVKDAEQWLENTAGIRGQMDHYQSDSFDGSDDTLTRSQLYGLLPAFWQFQYQYGTNALMMLAAAMEESDQGRSLQSYTKNNLYAHAAYDTSGEAERSRFDSLIRSVYSHSRYYLSGTFLSPLKTQFHGGFFGNKSAGMNEAYSDDPYWGELAAYHFRQLAEQFRDTSRCMLAVKTDTSSVNVRVSPSPYADALYRTGENPDMAFIVAGRTENEFGKWLRVRSDATLDENGKTDLSYTYDFSDHYGYIREDEVQVILNEQDFLVEDSYHTVVFNASGGVFTDGTGTVSEVVPDGAVPVCVPPQKDRALFSGWDREVTAAREDTSYKAVYHNIRDVSFASYPKVTYELNDRIDLRGGILQIIFSDGAEMSVPITTSMISGFDMQKEGEQEVTVSAYGFTLKYPIHVSEQKDSIRNELHREIIRLISAGEKKSSGHAQEVIDLKARIEENVMPGLTQSELRAFDAEVREAIGERIRYIIDDNPLDLSVSGLSVAMPLGESLHRQKYFEDTYRVQASLSGNSQVFERTAAYLNGTLREAFSFRIMKNYHETALNEQLLMSIAKPEGCEPGDVFTVLYYDEASGDVSRCYTRQSASKISFITKGTGTYAVISRLTSNVYDAEDPVESLRQDNNSYDTEALRMRMTVTGSVIIILLILLAYRMNKNRKKQLETVRAERVEKEKEIENETFPADTTAAMRLFETEVLNLSLLMEEEEENEDDQ